MSLPLNVCPSPMKRCSLPPRPETNDRIGSIHIQLTSCFVVVAARNFAMGCRHSQWIRLRLPSCSPGFESQAHLLRFYRYGQFVLYLSCENEDRMKDKERMEQR